jgi:hypothetical protein
MMSAEATNEGGNYGPNSWTYWQKQRQLLAAQAANEGGNYGEYYNYSWYVPCFCSQLPSAGSGLVVGNMQQSAQ